MIDEVWMGLDYWCLAIGDVWSMICDWMLMNDDWWMMIYEWVVISGAWWLMIGVWLCILGGRFMMGWIIGDLRLRIGVCLVAIVELWAMLDAWWMMSEYCRVIITDWRMISEEWRCRLPVDVWFAMICDWWVRAMTGGWLSAIDDGLSTNDECCIMRASWWTRITDLRFMVD